MHALSQLLVVKGHFGSCPNRLYRDQNATLKYGCNLCKRRLYWNAFWLTTFVSFVQFAGSLFTRSISLRSDAWHMLSDGAVYFVSARFERASQKHDKDPKRLAELRRNYEVVVAIMIAAVAFWIAGESLYKWIQEEPPEIVNIGWLFWIAVIGLLVNVLLLVYFHAFGIEHQHGHEHPHTHVHKKKDRILYANLLHTIGDTASSLLVIANSVVFYFTSDPVWRYLDLGVAIFIAALLMKQAVEMLTP